MPWATTGEECGVKGTFYEVDTLPALATSALPRINNLLDCVFKTDGDVPARIMVSHFSQVAVVADMVADAVFIDVGMNLFLAGE